MEEISRQETPRLAVRSYSAQYVSLILIILTFTAGAFARQKFTTVREIQAVKLRRAEMSAARFQRPLGVHNFAALFVADSLDENQAWALAEILKNHDLKAEIEVFFGGDLFLAARNSVRLLDYLLNQGVKASAVEIVARKRETPNLQVRVKWKQVSKDV